MADFPDIEADNYSFTLLYNTQSFESPLTKAIQTASLAGDQWRGVSTFTNRNGTEARALRAFILGLKGQTGRFNYTPPDLNQGGTLLGTPVIDGAGQLGDSINTKGWDYPQDNLILAGDYLTVNSELKMALADASTSAVVSYPDTTNLMPSPFDPEGWNANPNASISNITIENPSGESFVGLVDAAISSNLVLNRVENQPVIRGESQVVSYIFMDITNDYQLSTQFIDSTGVHEAEELVLDPSGNVAIPNPDLDFKAESLSGGYKLIQVKRDWLGDSTDTDSLFYARNTVVGTQLYVQAAFSGKNPLEYPYAQYNEFEDAAEVGEWDYVRTFGSVSGGLLNFTDDPDQSSGYLRREQSTGLTPFDGGKYSTLEVKWRPNASSGDPDSIFRFLTLEGGDYTGSYAMGFGPNTSNSETTTTGPDGSGFYITTFDFSNYSSWRDETVSGLRFDWDLGSDLGPADYDIDYIKIYSPSLLTAYEEWWPADVDGIANIQIAPPLRKNPDDLAPIEVEKPYMVAKLEDDEQTSFQVSSPIIYNATFSIVEAFL